MVFGKLKEVYGGYKIFCRDVVSFLVLTQSAMNYIFCHKQGLQIWGYSHNRVYFSGSQQNTSTQIRAEYPPWGRDPIQTLNQIITY